MGAKSFILGLLGVLFLTTPSYGATGPTDSLSIDDKIDIARTRCAPRTEDEPALFRHDVGTNTNHSLNEMSELYKKVYNSEKRLQFRVGFEPKTNSFVSSNDRESLNFPEHFIKSITLHIENALKLKYANFIFFPDMGHSHFFIPLDYYKSTHEGVGGSALASVQKLLNDRPEGLKTLYHTAEHLKMRDENRELIIDRFLQWRFYTRNPVMDLDGNIEIYTNLESRGGGNTVRKKEGYRFFSGFSISANKKGCFPFEDASGEIQYFDISAWEIQADCSVIDCIEDDL